MRSVLHAVIENARVTAVGDSLAVRVDAYILRAAELLPSERVDVVNLATRERVQTWIEELPEGCGEVQIHSGAKVGDTVAIIAFAHLHEGQTLTHEPRLVTLDDANTVARVTNLPSFCA